MIDVLKELSVFNRITFIESDHSYAIDNTPTNGPSVTRLLKRFKKKFEKEKIASRIAKRRRTTTAQILAEWELNNLYSTTLGSMLHKYIENYYCNKRVKFEGDFSGLGLEEKQKIAENLPILIEYFHNFYKDNTHLLCIKNEIVLGDLEDTKVCGMSDMLCFNEQTQELEILDFKTNKKMEKYSKYGDLFYPFDDMTEGEINEYTIQLNTYKYFIEKYTKLTVGKLKIVWFNINNPNYVLIELADIQPKIKLMFERFTSASLFQER
jgi:ATP-dependent exoDNAse (exonuclease V) beta subunit